MKKVLSTIAILATATAAFAQGYVNFNPGTTLIAQTNTAISPLFGGSGAGGVTGNTVAGSSGGLGAFEYALLIEPQTTFGVASTDTSVWDTTWTASGLVTSNSIVSGRITAGGSAIAVGGLANSLGQLWNGNNTSITPFGGTTNNIVLVGWSANLGSSWANVSVILAALAANNSAPLAAQLALTPGSTAFFGESAIGYIVPNFASPGAALFGAADANGVPILNTSASPDYLYALPVPEPGTMVLAGLGGLALMLIRRRK